MDELTKYDPADDLTTDAAIAKFMAEAVKTEDAGYIAHALSLVDHAMKMRLETE